MSQQQWTAVDNYISDMLVGSDPVLDAALAASAEAGLPQIQVTPNQGKLLYLIAKVQSARSILEMGRSVVTAQFGSREHCPKTGG